MKFATSLGEWIVSRVHLDRGGYDRRGKYFGVGRPVYSVTLERADGLDEYAYIRAETAWTLARHLRTLTVATDLRRLHAYGLP